MFSIGCIQAQSCHTNRCPTGVATQDPLRQRALVVEDKAQRVARFHRNTLHALAEIVGAAGFDKPDDLQPRHIMVRQKSGETLSAEEAYWTLEKGALVNGDCDKTEYTRFWDMARAESFRPVG
jgi:hypothetical protein